MKDRKKLIKYIVMAAVIIAAVIYFLKNPVSADKLSSLLEKNNPKAAAVILLLFSVKGFVPVILYMALAAACGLLFDLKYAIPIAIVGTVLNFTVSYLIGRIGKNDVNAMIERHEKLKKYYTKGEKYSFVLSLALHAVGLQSELLGTFFGSLGMPYLPYIASSVIGTFPGAVIWIILGGKRAHLSWYDFIPVAIDLIIIGISLFYLKKKSAKAAAESSPAEIKKQNS